jgi:hypothetical protein
MNAKPQIIITSTSPMPRLCAGVRITGVEAFPIDRFTADELKALIGDRVLTVVIGQQLAAGDVDEFLVLVASQDEAAKTGKTKA